MNVIDYFSGFLDLLSICEVAHKLNFLLKGYPLWLRLAALESTPPFAGADGIALLKALAEGNHRLIAAQGGDGLNGMFGHFQQLLAVVRSS